MIAPIDNTAGLSPALAAVLAERPLAVPPASVSPAAGPSGTAFGSMLGDLIKDVDARQTQAADSFSGMLQGKEVPLHQVMLQAEEASVSFQLMLEVRNKLMDGYQELMRMHQ